MPNKILNGLCGINVNGVKLKALGILDPYDGYSSGHDNLLSRSKYQMARIINWSELTSNSLLFQTISENDKINFLIFLSLGF